MTAPLPAPSSRVSNVAGKFWLRRSRRRPRGRRDRGRGRALGDVDRPHLRRRARLAAGVDGHYLAAEPDGTRRRQSPEAGEYERFTIEVRDVGVAFLSYHGSYMYAPKGGGGRRAVVRSSIRTRTVPGEWEFFASRAWTSGRRPPRQSEHLVGELERDERVIRDDDRAADRDGLPLHGGLQRLLLRQDHRRARRPTQLDIIAERYGVVRNLDVLGYWDATGPATSTNGRPGRAAKSRRSRSSPTAARAFRRRRTTGTASANT